MKKWIVLGVITLALVAAAGTRARLSNNGATTDVIGPATGAGSDTCTGGGCAIGPSGISTDGGVATTIGNVSVALSGKICLDGTGCTIYFINDGSSVSLYQSGAAYLSQPIATGSITNPLSGAGGANFIAQATSGNRAFMMSSGAKLCVDSSCTDYLSCDGTTCTLTGSAFAPSSYLGLGAFPTFIAATPTITFGGTGTSITGSGSSFVINVGTVAPGSSGTITFATTATNGYNCLCVDETATPLTQTKMSSDTTTTCVITNYTVATGAAANWTASDKIHCIAAAY